MTTIYLLCHGSADESQAEALRGLGVGAIHCGDMPCCREAAAILARRLRVSITEHRELRELFPGGESFADCLSRVLPTWQSISRSGHTAIAVIGHADLNRILLGHVLALPVEELFRIDQDHGCVSVIECHGSRPWVRLLNGSLTDLPPAVAGPRDMYYRD